MPPGFVDSVSSHPSFPPYFCYMYALKSPLRPEKGSLSEVLLINPFSQSVCRTALASDDDELQCNAVLYCRGSLIISPEDSSSEEDESVRAEDTAPPVESRESMSLIERIYVAGCFSRSFIPSLFFNRQRTVPFCIQYRRGRKCRPHC